MQRAYMQRAVFAGYAIVATGFGLDQVYQQQKLRSRQLPLMEQVWFFTEGALAGPPGFVINKSVQGMAWFRDKH